jgi:hypothetical protein
MSAERPGTPSLGEALEQIFDDRLGELRAIEPAKVEAFNRASQVATVRPLVLGRGGRARPPLYRVPVVFPVAYYDVQDEETGLLLVADEDWRSWWRTGEASSPATRLSHDLSNAVFLPGFRPSTNPHSTLPSEAAVLEKPTASGTVRLGDPSATKAVLHEDLLSDLDAMLADWRAYIALFDTWAAAVGTATGVAWTGQPVQAALNTLDGEIGDLRTGIAGSDYESPTVKVED